MRCVENHGFQKVSSGGIKWQIFLSHDATGSCHQGKSKAQPCSFYPESGRCFASLARSLLFAERFLSEEQKTWILCPVVPLKKVHAALFFLCFLLILLIAVDRMQYALRQMKEIQVEDIDSTYTLLLTQRLADLVELEHAHFVENIADEMVCLMGKEEAWVEEEVF